MNMQEFQEKLERARDIPEIFELVKLAVRKTWGKERSGLMLALSDLGGGPEGFVGAYYPVATNIIVMNRMPLLRIRQKDPHLYRPYIFHILLHEYIHSLGIMDEAETRKRVREISEKVLGPEHPASQLAADITRFMPNLVYPMGGWEPREGQTLELIRGFDRSATDNYIR